MNFVKVNTWDKKNVLELKDVTPPKERTALERTVQKFFFRYRKELTNTDVFFQYWFLQILTWEELISYWDENLLAQWRIFEGMYPADTLLDAAREAMITLIPRYRYMLIEYEQQRTPIFDQEEIENLSACLQKAAFESIYKSLADPNPAIRKMAEVNALRALKFARHINNEQEEEQYVIGIESEA